MQILAQHRGHFDVEIVQRDDAIDLLRSGEKCCALANVIGRHVAADVIEGVDRVARPVRVLEFLVGQQQHTAALAIAFLEELVPFAVGRDT